LLSQLAIRLASHDELGRCLVWRGGTCLHKLHLIRARRYSEDLDYVLVGRAGPTGWLVDAIRSAVVASPLKEVSRNVVHGSVKIRVRLP
jgi:predicted nucleotidyltransferase component of viral defense system